MKLYIANGNVSIIGKLSEADEINTRIRMLANVLNDCQSEILNLTSDKYRLQFAYDSKVFGVNSVRNYWTSVKAKPISYSI